MDGTLTQILRELVNAHHTIDQLSARVSELERQIERLMAVTNE